MLQRNTEQADPQQAIEVEDQIRRLSNLQLPGMENKSIHHHQPSPSIGSHAHFPSQVREGCYCALYIQALFFLVFIHSFLLLFSFGQAVVVQVRKILNK